MKYPIILRLLIPLIIGVILHFYSGLYVNLESLFAALLVLLILSLSISSRLLKGSEIWFSFSTFIALLMLGGYLSHVHSSTENESYFFNEEDGWSNYLVRVNQPPQEKDNSVKCVVDVFEVNEHQVTGQSLLYIQKDEYSLKLKYGDILYFNSRFNTIRSNGNPKEFDYARYLSIHNIHEQAYVQSDKWSKVGSNANPFYSEIYELRDFFSSVLKNSGMSEKNAMVANALILGQKEYLDKDVLRSYSSAGAMHVLAVSGLHVGIIMLILNFAFAPLKRVKRGRGLFIITVLSGIWFYALITGMSPSVLRAGVMFSFIVIGKELQRDTTVYQSILVSAFILILIEPYIIFQVGFQLSYLAVLGIVYLQPKIENLWYIKNKVLFKAWQISAVSIAAQIATFPLGLYYFHQFPNFFLISNLLVIPLAFFILILGISFLIVHAIPWLSDVIFWIFDGLISILNVGVEWVEKLPYSITWGISIQWYEVIILYLTILFASIAFIHRRSKAMLLSLVGVVMILSINLLEHHQLKNEDKMYVYNINDDVALDLFYGRENIFISSQNLLNDKDKLLFHVQHNWFYRSGAEEPTEWRDLDQTPNFVFADKTFSILDSSRMKEPMIAADYSILFNCDFLPNPFIENFKENNTTLILGGNVSYSLKNYLQNHHPELNIYDLKKEGAFSLTY